MFNRGGGWGTTLSSKEEGKQHIFYKKKSPTCVGQAKGPFNYTEVTRISKGVDEKQRVVGGYVAK